REHPRNLLNLPARREKIYGMVRRKKWISVSYDIQNSAIVLESLLGIKSNHSAKSKKAYHLWAENPDHPSLRFKCINRYENAWSVRISRNYRAVGLLEGDSVTWIWIGNHDTYEKFFG